jgi:hypothetical protein
MIHTEVQGTDTTHPCLRVLPAAAYVRHLANRRQLLDFMQVNGNSCLRVARAASGMRHAERSPWQLS